jgi:hypothetical protein
MLTMSTEPSAFLTSQVQPEPKLPTAEVWKAVLKASSEPHLALMASARAPLRSAAAVRLQAVPEEGVVPDLGGVVVDAAGRGLLDDGFESRFSYSVPLIRLFRLVT